MSTVCLFPGQGSQSKGMGADLFDRFADWAAVADRVLGYSIRTLCLEDPSGQLGQTEFTQPALFVVNAMMYRAWLADHERPVALAGHSLGEYNALVAAGVLEFEAALVLVRVRGQLMGRVRGGGMAAVIGLDPGRLQALLQESAAGQRVDVANFNSFDQTVLAGPLDDLSALRPAVEAAGARAFIPLNVSAPFHSRYMREAAAEFATALDAATFAAPSVPVIANVTGKPYAAPGVRETLAQQIDHSVRWLDSMLYLLDSSASDFAEVGPGTVLTKLLAQIRKKRPADQPTSSRP